MFGHPKAHENDVFRAVQAGLEITRDVARLSEQANRRFGAQINVRVGVHRGLVYLDTSEDDVYGLAANLAARVSSLAPANAVVVSDAVEPLIRHAFETEALPAAPVKGVEGLINHFRVADERAEASRARGPLVGRDRELARLQKSWARAQSGTLTTPGWCFAARRGSGRAGWRRPPSTWWSATAVASSSWWARRFNPTPACIPSACFLRSAAVVSAGIRTRRSACGCSTVSLPGTGWIPLAEVPLLAPVVASPPSTAITRCPPRAASCRS